MHVNTAFEEHPSNDASHDKLPKLQQLHSDGVSSEREMKDTQSFEEECGWETMSPTLPSQCKRYKPSLFEHRTGLSHPQDVYLGKGSGSHWHQEAMQPQPDNPANVVDELDVIPKGWNYVEVATSFDHLLLRDWEGKALLAPGESLLFVEAHAFHKAMKEITPHKEVDVVFCLESEVLYDCMQMNSTVPIDISVMLKDRFIWCEKHSFRVFFVERGGAWSL